MYLIFSLFYFKEISDLELYNRKLLERLTAVQEQLVETEKWVKKIAYFCPFSTTTAKWKKEDKKKLIYHIFRRVANMEAQIREEVSAELAEQLVEIEQSYQTCLRQQSETQEAGYEKKLNILTNSVARMPARKRVADNDDDSKAVIAVSNL